MKLAFLYSGNLRTLNETIENNINSFKFAKIDCYISTWDKITYTDKINSPDHIFSNRLLSGDVSYNLLNTLTYFKVANIEKYKEINFNLNFGIDNPGLGNQYYKIYDVLKLVDNINNYDALVRLRCDFKIKNAISKDLLSEYIENKNIIHTSKIWYNHEWTGQKSINEMFWISPPCFINQTCGIINNVHKINKLTDSLNYGEKICYMNLEAENLIKHLKTYDFDYQILR